MSETKSSSGTTSQDGKSPVSSPGDSSPLFPAPGGGASPLIPDPEVAAGLQADRERQEKGWRADLARLEYEIETLRTVLIVKNNQAAELKRRLGITPMTEMKQDLQQSIQTLKESEAYQKTGTAFRNFGDFASRKLSDMRNSTAFKSVEEKVGGAYQSVKTRSVSGRADGGVENDPSTVVSASSEPSAIVNPGATTLTTGGDAPDPHTEGSQGQQGV